MGISDYAGHMTTAEYDAFAEMLYVDPAERDLGDDRTERSIDRIIGAPLPAVISRDTVDYFIGPLRARA